MRIPKSFNGNREYDRISVKVKQQDYEFYKEEAGKWNLSLNQFLLRCMAYCVGAENSI